MFNIIMWEDETGYSPVDAFLDELKTKNSKLYVKTMRTLGLLESTGNMLGMPFSKHLRDGIHELRTTQGNDSTRLFYFFSANKVVIVDHAIEKKTQKTPKEDIRLAIERKQSYERRNENDIQRKTDQRSERS